MKVLVKDHVQGCYTNDDGEIIQNIIRPLLEQKLEVTLSFKNVNATSSSFINTAIIDLLFTVNYDTIKEFLKIVDSNKSINDLIKRRFHFEINEREPKLYETLK